MWQNQSLDRVYPWWSSFPRFVDGVPGIHVKIRDGKVTNRPIYVAVGVTVRGERDIRPQCAGRDP